MSERRTVVGRFIHSTWTNINIRAANGRYAHHNTGLTAKKNQRYAQVMLHFERAAFAAWCRANHQLIETIRTCARKRLSRCA